MCMTAGTIEAAGALQPGSLCPGGACKGLCKRPPMAAALRALAVTETAPVLPMPVAESFTADILKPYRNQARYLKSAEITQFCDKADIIAGENGQRLATSRGSFAIPESCYIDDTGHFNAVEFNICYNQLAYVTFAKLIEAKMMHRLRTGKVDVLTIPEFKQHQLPAMVIVSLESRYYKQLDSKGFTGDLSIDKISPVGDAWFFFTSISFADKDGVKAKGSVVLAFSPSYNPKAH